MCTRRGILKNRLMLVEGAGGTVYVSSDFFDTDKVIMAFSTRFGGTSPKPFNSMNLGFTVADERENVMENRMTFIETFTDHWDRTIIGKQDHGNTVRIVNSAPSGDMLINPDHGLDSTDGLVTTQPMTPLVGTFADCVPVYFYDPTSDAVAIVHAGWKGVAGEIVKVAVDKILSLGGRTDTMMVIVGPSIGPCCYEVGEELLEYFKGFSYQKKVFSRVKNRLHLDLWSSVAYQLLEKGLYPDHILIPHNWCTSCLTDLFFSYRNGGNQTGRMMGMIMIK